MLDTVSGNPPQGNRMYWLRRAYAACGLLALSLSYPAVATESWRLLTTPTMRPFAPLMQQLMAQADIQTEIRIVPQARLIDELGQGLADGAFFLTPKSMQAVAGLEPVPVALHHYELVAVTRDTTEQFKGLHQLAGYRVGLERGNQVSEQLVGAAALPKLYRANSVPVLVQAFAAERFDILLLGRDQVARQMNRVGIRQYVVHEPPLAEEPLYLMVTAKRAAEVARLTRIFEQVVHHGNWTQQKDEILRRYLQ